MNGHHHRHHKKEEGNGKYIAGIVLSILVIIAAIVIAVWTITGGFGGPEEKTGQAALEAGLHRLSIRYFDSNGGIFEAGFTDRAGRHTPIPAAMLRH